MTVILVRTILIYFILTAVMRMMGKRQLGELQVSELISTLVLSEVAAIPITDPNIPFLFAILPIGLIVSLEIILPELFFHFPKLRKFVEGTPSFLIHKGKINQKELRKNRITPEEFLASLRTAGVADPADVDYAILEASGNISVFRYAAAEPPLCRDYTPAMQPTESGISHILVSNGRINYSTLRGIGLSEADIRKSIRRYHRPLKDIYLLTRDDTGKEQLIWRTRS